MRAVCVSKVEGSSHLKSVELPEPHSPGRGEITVRIRASSLNYHDYLVVVGAIPTAEGRIPLSDCSGEVTAIGDGVAGLKVGDNVISLFMPDWVCGLTPDPLPSRIPGDGIDGYARASVTAPASFFTPAPAALAHREAATLPCAGVTAWRAVSVEAALQPGATLLVQGTGGVSVFALQFAKALGVSVIATSSSDAKLERLEALGAEHVINYIKTPNWAKEARRMTGGVGVDAVIDVGGATTLAESMKAVRANGTIVVLGVLTGRDASIPLNLLFARQMTIKGQIVGSRQHQIDMLNAIDRLNIVPITSEIFDLAKLANAFRFQETGKHFGKIIIDL